MSVVITNHLWIWWAQIAIEHETTAADARRQAMPLTPAGDGFGEVFSREARSSMIAISAAAHALDALYGSVKSRVPESTAEDRPMHIFDALRAAIYVRGSAGGGRWAAELKWLFGLRDAAVHFEEKAMPSVPHPTGTHSGVENATYALENANRAVALLIEVLETFVQQPRPDFGEWPASFRHAVEDLVAQRPA